MPLVLNGVTEDFMEESKKPLTEAEKQILRLESLRAKREDDSKKSVEKAFYPPKTQAERTIDKLTAMRRESQKAPQTGKRKPKIEGKQKSAKVPYLQITVMEQLLLKDKRLKGSQIIRIALSRLLELDLNQDEMELETRIGEILRQIKNRS